jgi:hypothetical protein
MTGRIRWRIATHPARPRHADLARERSCSCPHEHAVGASARAVAPRWTNTTRSRPRCPWFGQLRGVTGFPGWLTRISVVAKQLTAPLVRARSASNDGRCLRRLRSRHPFSIALAAPTSPTLNRPSALTSPTATPHPSPRQRRPPSPRHRVLARRNLDRTSHARAPPGARDRTLRQIKTPHGRDRTAGIAWHSRSSAQTQTSRRRRAVGAWSTASPFRANFYPVERPELRFPRTP